MGLPMPSRWEEPPLPNTGPESCGSYEVQLYNHSREVWVDLPTDDIDIVFNGSSAVVSGLLPKNSFWHFQVRAVNAAGESGWSEIVQVVPTKASDWESEGDNSPATGAPTISGTAQVEETLTADRSGIAKMEGQWRRGESLPCLPAEHYALFPDRLVDSELGEIPEGWEVKALGYCYDLTMGQSPPGSTYNENGMGLPFFQGSTDFGDRYPTNRRYCTKPSRLAQTEDTLVSVRAPVGTINRAWERCCIGRSVAALRHKSGSAPYTYYAIWAAQPEIGQYEHTGTVFGAIGGQQFRSLQILEPPQDVIVAFECIGQHFDSLIRSNVAESRALAAQRDVLLPGLVSGKMGVEGHLVE